MTAREQKAIRKVLSKPAGFRPREQLSAFRDEHQLRQSLHYALHLANKLQKHSIAQKIQEILNELSD